MIQNLPFDAVIFDLDGVITKTALVHSTAWKEMFDSYLKARASKLKEPFIEFTHEGDYLKYVDGKPRYQGVKSFLESRGINIPFGTPDDSSDLETCCGIGNLKNTYFNNILQRDGVSVYDSTVELMLKLKEAGVRIGVASSSKNCETVLKAAGLLDIIETRVDGVVSEEIGLKGKPEPDIFTTAADNLGVKYHKSVIVEDALSGVQAGRKGNFGLVIGIAREDNHNELLANGADIVVSDLEEITIDDLVNWFEIGLENDQWKLTYHDYDIEKERSREALLSVGNGYFGTRGAMEEVGINKVNYPGTYMAGLFNRLTSSVSGREIDNEDFVNAINWLPITWRIDEEDWFDINKTKILKIERNLDFKTGMLFKTLKVEDEKSRITMIYTRRFASMDNQNHSGIHYCLQPVNYSATITYKSSIDGTHINDGVARYAELNQKHLKPSNSGASDNWQFVQVKTTQSQISVNAVARLEVLYNSTFYKPKFEHNAGNGFVESTFQIAVNQGEYLGLMKSVYLSNSLTDSNFRVDLSLRNIPDFESIMQRSQNRWNEIWKKIDIKIEGNRISQKLIRLHLYHLISGTSEHNKEIDFGIPARGLTGEAYRGHIFWDELYILPFYFIHYPDVAKSILMYRYRRLDAARAYAKEFGYDGAMFPWQSGSDGREETQKFHFNPISGTWGDDHSSLQRHVSLAIAYNIIQYHKFTGDDDFMCEYGMEMLLEINRFWLSKCSFDESLGRYIIDKVMGPDEFHEAYPGAFEGGLRNNAYTNIMTLWMAKETLRLVNSLPKTSIDLIKRKISFTQAELGQWDEISKKLFLDISDDGIIAQYEGYFDLKELDWDYYHQKYGNVHRMDRVLKAEGKSPDEFKVAKQADTLMTFYNIDNQEVTDIITQLGYDVPKDYVNRNLEYYLKRTSHGSTLSRVVHSYLSSKLNLGDLSWSMYFDALNSDYNDIQGGTTAEGIHTGVMAGTVWIIVNTFAGVHFGDVIEINPNLPKVWDSLSFGFSYKGVRYKVKIDNQNVEIESDSNVEIKRGDKIIQLTKDVLTQI